MFHGSSGKLDAPTTQAAGDCRCQTSDHSSRLHSGRDGSHAVARDLEYPRDRCLTGQAAKRSPAEIDYREAATGRYDGDLREAQDRLEWA